MLVMMLGLAERVLAAEAQLRQASARAEVKAMTFAGQMNEELIAKKQQLEQSLDGERQMCNEQGRFIVTGKLPLLQGAGSSQCLTRPELTSSGAWVSYAGTPPIWSPIMPLPKYIVRLTAEERTELEELTRTGKRAASTILHARILLKADAGATGPGWPIGGSNWRSWTRSARNACGRR